MSGLQTMQSGSRSNSNAEKYNYYYWDRHVIASNVLEVDLFKVPVGQPAPSGVAKNLADTNLIDSGKVANGKKFLCKEIQMHYSSNGNIHNSSDIRYLYQMIENTTILLDIDGKQDMGRWCLSHFFGSTLNFACAADKVQTPDLGISEAQNATTISIFKSSIKLTIPLVLASLQNFSFKLRHHVAPDAVLNGDSLKMTLIGVQASLQ